MLLPVDQSESSGNAVDFVGQMLGNDSAHQGLSIMLMHVIESLPDFILKRITDANTGEVFRQVADEWKNHARTDGENLLEANRKLLQSAGIPAQCINTKVIVKEALPEAKKVVAALSIIEEMKQGDYEIICVGRRGTSLAPGIFIGSVAEKVLREAQGRTVWVVD